MSQNELGEWEYSDGGFHKNSRRSLRRISLVVMILSLLALILLGTYNHRKAAADPKFCANCHEMKPSYEAWQTTAHSKVDCLQCHKDVSIFNNLYKHVIGVNRTRTMKVTVDDSSCKSCHSDARVITPPQSLLVPHTLHLQMGLDCTQCHRTVAHGNIVKTVSNAAPGQTGSALTGDNLFDPTRIPMSGCMTCHNGTKATQACNACHQDKDPPSTHRQADFGTEHGYIAAQNPSACNSCHQYDVPLQAKFKQTGNKWQDTWTLARTTDFCSGCHQKRPVGHRTLYTVNHVQTASQDVDRCLTCHNWDEKGRVTAKPATTVICVQCHYNQHPANFQQIHPKLVDKSTESKCFTCHDASSCNNCHNRTFRARQ